MKAKVNILQQRNVQNNLVIEAEVEIKGVREKKRFVMNKNLNQSQIIENISKALKEPSIPLNISSFEVDI